MSMTNKQVQLLLAYLGYYSGDTDGIVGSKTKAAIRSFQSATSGLAVDGIAGTKTQEALKKAVASDSFKAEATTTTTASVTTTSSAKTSTSTSKTSSTGTFWDDIKYFSRSEFKCQCGKCNGFPAEPQEKLVRIAERMREHFGTTVTISSGVRCTTHNAEVGGVANSRHLSGKAMDFSVKGKTATQILAWTKAQSDLRYSYAINATYVHMDIT